MHKNYRPTKDWQISDPASLKMDTEQLSELEAKIKSDYSNINGIVVVSNGYIAYEQYFNGYGPDDLHHVASVTKSILSALIGIAIDAGYIKHVDQKVLDFSLTMFPTMLLPTRKNKKSRYAICST